MIDWQHLSDSLAHGPSWAAAVMATRRPPKSGLPAWLVGVVANLLVGVLGAAGGVYLGFVRMERDFENFSSVVKDRIEKMEHRCDVTQDRLNGIDLRLGRHEGADEERDKMRPRQ